MTANGGNHLLIARKNGSSSSRRQRSFPATRIDAAVARWRKEGFNVFWLYGPRPNNGDPRPIDDNRPLIRQWQEGTP